MISKKQGDLEGNTKAKTYHDMLKELSQIDDKLAVIRTEIQRMAGKYDYDDSETAKNEGKSTANFSVSLLTIIKLENFLKENCPIFGSLIKKSSKF